VRLTPEALIFPILRCHINPSKTSSIFFNNSCNTQSLMAYIWSSSFCFTPASNPSQ
jgi:hypothetical protein